MNKEQYVLGLNGYSRRTHSASACLLKNGEILAMAEEERFSRRKNAFGEVPHHAIAYCLNEADISIDDLDVVGIGWDLNRLFVNAQRPAPTAEEVIETYFPSQRFRYQRKPRIEYVSHHLAHAASAFYASGFPESAVLVLDGQGESQSTSLFKGSGDILQLIDEYPVSASLGYFYEAVSEYIGLSAQEPGKTMGLASYGKPKFEIDPIQVEPTGYSVDLNIRGQKSEFDQQESVTRAWLEFFERKFGPKNNVDYQYNPETARFVKVLRLGQKEKDFAASAQAYLELAAMGVLKHLKNVTSSENLCIAGGVGLNCSMNGRVLKEGIFPGMFMPPFVNDAGVSIGAALYLSDQKPKTRLEHAYFGPSFTNDQIRATLEMLGIGFQEVDDISQKVAILLSQGNIVSWFQGRMEVGPRALGNRSILADPRTYDSHTRANQVKNRERWRPLAPSFVAEEMADYVHPYDESPFMLKAFTVKADKKESIPAVVHVDDTLRAQSVKSEVNPRFHALIKRFRELTGIPTVLNTSFNLDSEPIVCSPYDALRSFLGSRADNLAIGDFLVTKK